MPLRSAEQDLAHINDDCRGIILQVEPTVQTILLFMRSHRVVFRVTRES